MSDQPNMMTRLRSRLPRMRWALRKIIFRKPPKGDVYYGDMAALYDTERTRTKRWHREHAAVEEFLQQLPMGMRVLDVPIGTGRFLELYKLRACQVEGFDSSHEMLAEAERRAQSLGFEISIVQGDATNLPYESGAFDLVVSTRFLRHVLPFEAAKKALREMARVTGGHAIVEMGYNGHETRWPAPDKPMRQEISHDDMVELFRESGLEVVARQVTQRYEYNLSRRKKRRAVFLLRKIPATAGQANEDSANGRAI